MTHDTEAMLAERATKHGDFTDVARCAQALTDTFRREEEFRNQRGQKALTAIQKEGIEMVLHKIARIMAGDADNSEHWEDMEGYAALVRLRLTPEDRANRAAEIHPGSEVADRAARIPNTRMGPGGSAAKASSDIPTSFDAAKARELDKDLGAAMRSVDKTADPGGRLVPSSKHTGINHP